MILNDDLKGLHPYVSEYMKKVREDAGFTKSDLKKMYGMEENTLYKVETGRRNPSILYAMRLATMYGMSFEAFFQGLGKYLDEIKKTL